MGMSEKTLGALRDSNPGLLVVRGRDRCILGSASHRRPTRQPSSSARVEGPRPGPDTRDLDRREYAVENGFSNVTHTMEIFGTCLGCSRR